VVVARLWGELDRATVPSVRGVLEDVVPRLAPRRLVIDLSGVTLMSSRAIELLVSAHRWARVAGFHVVLVGASHRSVARPLRATGVLKLFETRRDIPHAVQPGLGVSEVVPVPRNGLRQGAGGVR
jgi:anti-anti-sigma factor